MPESESTANMILPSSPSPAPAPTEERTNLRNKDSSKVFLISSDGLSFIICRSAARLSGVVAGMIEDDNNHDDDDDDERKISLPSKQRQQPQQQPQQQHPQHHPDNGTSRITKTKTTEKRDDALEIPLPNVPGKILSKIIEFCEYYIHDPMPPIAPPFRSNQISNLVPQWYAKYITEMEWDIRRELIVAANYMSINPLLRLACLAIAIEINGKTADEIRPLFGISNEFLDHEREEVELENQWHRGTHWEQQQLNSMSSSTTAASDVNADNVVVDGLDSRQQSSSSTTTTRTMISDSMNIYHDNRS